MAVAVSASANFQNSTGTTNTVAFDCSGGSSLVGLTEDATNTAGNTTGITYNGTSLTEIARAAPTGQNREVTCFAMHNPDSGTNNLIATRTSTSSRFILASTAFSGTDTGVSLPPSSGYIWDASQSATTSINRTFGNTGGEGVAFIVKGVGGSVAASTGSTVQNTYSDSAMSGFVSDPTPAETDQYCQVNFGSGANCAAGVALAAAAGVTRRVFNIS